MDLVGQLAMAWLCVCAKARLALKPPISKAAPAKKVLARRRLFEIIFVMSVSFDAYIVVASVFLG